MHLTKRTFIIVIAFFSLCLNIYFLYRFNNYQYKNIHSFLTLEHNTKIKPGIYLTYPLEDGFCSPCVWALFNELNNYSEREINLLLPQNVNLKNNRFFKNTQVIRFKKISNLLKGKLFFVDNKGLIVLCIDINFLINQNQKSMRNFIFEFEARLE